MRTIKIGLACLMCMLTATLMSAQNAPVSMQDTIIALSEVTVKAQSVIVKDDRKLLIPTQEQVRMSTDGIDMMRKMQLPRIMVDPTSGEVTMTDNLPVQLRINGVQVTNAEIASIPPADILRIEYVDDPGARYGNVGAVINYITRRNDSGGNINAVAFNSAGDKRLSADDRLSLKYNHGRSEWSANAVYVQRHGYWTREYDEWLNAPDASLHRVEVGEPTLFDKRTFNANLNYSLADKDYFFNAQLTYRLNDFPNSFDDRRSKLYESDAANPLSITDHTVEKSHSPALDLYFQRNLKNNQLLIFNAVGTYINTDSKHSYQEATMNGTPETDIYSHIDGRKYSLIAEGIYEKKFGTNKLTTGVRHLQSYTDNRYDGTTTADVAMNQAETYAYAEYQGRTGQWGYMANLTGARLYYSQESNRTEKFTLQPSARITFEPNRDSYLRYRINLRTQAPLLASLNDVTQAVDEWVVRRGNPSLQSYQVLNQSFTAGYNKGTAGIDLIVGYDYEFKPIMESVFYENGKFVHTEENQRSFQNLSAELVFRLKPWKNHLSLSVAPCINRFISEGNDYLHTYTMFELRVNADFSYNRWVANFSTITPPRIMYGEHVTKSDQMCTVMAGYKMPHWSLMVGVLNPFLKEYKTDNENWASLNPVKSLIHTQYTQAFVVKLAVNLNYGKQGKKLDKRVDNADTDAGIMPGRKSW